MIARFVALGVFLAAAAPVWAESAEQHVAAAKKAEKRGEWRRALQEWQAAYRLDINAEYLIGIGDAHAHLGNRAEARKQYEAYLADPLALPANAAVVKGKIAALDASGSGATALEVPPGTAPPPALALPAEPANGKAKKGKKEVAAAPPPPGALELPAPGRAPPAPAPAKKETEVALALPELPAAKPAPAAAKKDPGALPLPALELPALPTADAGKKAASAGPATTQAKPGPTVAVATPSTGTKPAGPETRKAPGEALTSVESRPSPVPSGGGAQRVVAWVAAGVAVAALGGGVLAYTKASSAQSDLTKSVHDGATAQRLLEDEKRNKTLSFVGLAGGLVAAGIATALFTF